MELILLLIILQVSHCIAYSISNFRQLIADQVQNVIHSPTTNDATTVRNSLLSSNIIPDVLDDFKPKYSLDLTYASSHTSVSLGNDIPVEYVEDRPVFEIHSLSPDEQMATTKKNSTFTLALTDPDAKSRDNPKWSEMCHWILTNITVADVAPPIRLALPKSNIRFCHRPYASKPKVDELVSYQPPGPPPKTGKHRYVFVLLKGKEDDKLEKPKDRQHWGYGKVRHGVRDWAEENRLKIVGANWFYAQDEKQ